MSISLTARIAARKVAANEVVAWWLGGSGFIFKFPAAPLLPGDFNGSSTKTGLWARCPNCQKMLYRKAVDQNRGVCPECNSVLSCSHTICIDPYLSNSVKAIFDLGRAAPSPIAPDELDVDLVIATHWHEDHLDPGTIPHVAKSHPQTRFIAPPTAAGRAMGWGVPRDSITAFSTGSEFVLGNTKITHAPARHDAGFPGWETPDAMGVFLRTPGLTIYQTGDTEYDIKLRLLRDQKPDVAILCINGAGGNMDAHEAALLAWQLKAKTVIPMHHILWDRKLGPEIPTLDPQLFADTYRNLGGKGKVLLPVIGEEIVLNTDSR